MSDTARYAQLLLPMLWVGMLFAISFLEAPIKFRAPGVTLPIGLSIGRLVFKMLNTIEVVLLVVLSAASFAAYPGVAWVVLLVAVAIVLLVQLVFVRPPLSRRSDRIMAGEDLPRSRVHWVYIGLELAKVGLLVGLAVTLVAGVVECMP